MSRFSILLVFMAIASWPTLASATPYSCLRPNFLSVTTSNTITVVPLALLVAGTLATIWLIIGNTAHNAIRHVFAGTVGTWAAFFIAATQLAKTQCGLGQMHSDPTWIILTGSIAAGLIAYLPAIPLSKALNGKSRTMKFVLAGAVLAASGIVIAATSARYHSLIYYPSSFGWE